MPLLGQATLLVAFVASGFAAFACLLGGWRRQAGLVRAGAAAGGAAVVALGAATAVLVWALLARDFRFLYVAQYCSRQLPDHYAVSALWVGQAGSLLVWAWFSAVAAVAAWFHLGRSSPALRDGAFGLLVAWVWLLTALMVFGADPMQPAASIAAEGAGLSPLLQHPAMLLHPPVVFLGYAGWAVPCALALAALASGRLEAAWLRAARPWAVASWLVLGAGILLGADWAYEELGWGGYWAWDPVENGSLVPWLTGTAFLHGLMVWHRRGALKKTTLSLAVSTFALCSFATFLTRSGVFSSLHAFGESAIGWVFLAVVPLLAIALVALAIWRRRLLAAERPIESPWSTEALIGLGILALVLLTAATTAGTLVMPLSQVCLGRRIAVGPAFYNNVLVLTGMVLVALAAAAPLTRWAAGPSPAQKRRLAAAAITGGIAAAGGLALGLRHPLALAVTGLTAFGLVALAGALWLETAVGRVAGRLRAVWHRRRRYGGLVCHVGLLALAVGIAGTSLGTRRTEAVMAPGDNLAWNGYKIRYAGLLRRHLRDRYVVEADLAVSRGRGRTAVLRPAQHLHLLQNEWTTEVAIDSTWTSDFYAILHAGQPGDRAILTLVENPMMRWIWLSGCLAAVGAVIAVWPGRRRSGHGAGPPPPNFLGRRRQATVLRKPGNAGNGGRR